MTKAEAGKLVKRMLGSYPSLNLHDPETYIAAVCSLLMSYPLWAGENALRRALGADECKFIPPTQGILRPILEDEVRVARYAEEWDKGAAQLALPAPPGPTPEERAAFIAKRRAELGPHFGIDQGRPRPPMAESREALRKQIGDDAFNALPDAGWRSDDWQAQQVAEHVAEQVDDWKQIGQARALAGQEGA